MASGIFGIGLSGLNAAQAGLLTTGHNISNAATPGYSRQEVVQASAIPLMSGGSFIGEGTEVSTVRRTYSDFLGTQALHAETMSSQLDTYHAQISQIDNILADPAAGLSPALQGFFGTVQDLSSHPDSRVARQVVLDSAESLVARFHTLDGRIDEIRQGVNGAIGAGVVAINSHAQQIARLNENILQLQNSAGAQPPNDLLDQRDALVAELNREVRATVVKQNDGSYSVFIGQGQALVMGSQAHALATTTSAAAPDRVQVGYVSNGNIVPLQEQSLQGGKLGGVLAFRSETLDSVSSQLDQIAVGLVTSFNAQHQLGQDFNGNPGGVFFASGSSSAKNIAVAITNAAEIAAAAPVRTARGSANTGTGSISAGSVNPGLPWNTHLQQAVTITFTSATRFDVSGTGTGNPTGLSYTAGQDISFNGWTIQIAGVPAGGDSFSVGPNSGGSGDSRNALLLGALQTQKTVGGNASYQSAYAQLVGQVGSKTRELAVTSAAQTALATRVNQAQDAVSGVNLDEEAAGLLRYQQAYQASAKVLQIAGRLFDDILNLGG